MGADITNILKDALGGTLAGIISVIILSIWNNITQKTRFVAYMDAERKDMIIIEPKGKAITFNGRVHLIDKNGKEQLVKIDPNDFCYGETNSFRLEVSKLKEEYQKGAIEDVSMMQILDSKGKDYEIKTNEEINNILSKLKK